MRKATLSRTASALVVRDRKSAVLKAGVALEDGDYICLMSGQSGCNRILNDSITNPKHPKHAKSGNCHGDYQALRNIWSDPKSDWTREQMEKLGWIKPPRRDLQFRLITELERRYRRTA